MKYVILGSGRGSNADALLRAQAEGRLGPARCVGVFCDKAGAGILGVAARHGVPSFTPDPGAFRTKFAPEVEAAWADALRETGAELVVLAGFMRVIKAPLLDAFPGRIINLHPSLLPAFPGLDAIGQAWRMGVRYAGCTVHFVDATVDGGRIIDQAAVRREDSDTLESLEEKVHAAEHALLPGVVRGLALGEIR